MDFFSILKMLGGLAFFLYGMHVMSGSLEKLAGSKLEGTLKAMTSNPFKGLLLGAVITIAIQSSSAMTVMLVGFVNSGLMSLSQTIGVIMGSNIGTTVTTWLFSLAGIESSSFFMRLLKPSSFSPVLAFIGVLLIMMTKRGKKKDIGIILVGFAVLMYGMTAMGDAVAPLAESDSFTRILTLFSNPFLGVLVGAVFTAIIQSSAASIGILQAFALTGGLSFGAALPIILGQNIGTCITSAISAIGTTKSAKRVAVIHFYIKLIGTVLFLAVFYLLNTIFRFSFAQGAINAPGIALLHSVFNISTTILLFPFQKLLEKLACLTIPDNKNSQETTVFLDERLLLSPAFAIAECSNQMNRMARLTKESYRDALGLYKEWNDTVAEKVERQEDIIDTFEDKLGTFLVRLSSCELSHDDSTRISELLHTLGDIERISDHALNLQHGAVEMHEKKLTFSPRAQSELETLTAAVNRIVELTFDAFENRNLQSAREVEPLTEVIGTLKEEVSMRHIDRLKKGQCTIELGFILSDILSNYERIADHCSNIAACMIEINEENALATHVYVKDRKTSGEEDFNRRYDEYKQEYTLPQV